MWKWIRILILCLCLPAAAGAGDRVDLLVYRVKEPGLAPYVSRILVSDAFVRIDEGAASPNGYTLYNRVSHRIYNVDPEGESVLVLEPPLRQPRPPEGFLLEQRLDADPDAPPVGGRPVHRLELRAQGRVCRVLRVVPGLMPRAVQGLRELRLALARLQGVPDEEEARRIDPCELAEYHYAPERALSHGLPVLDRMGERSRLLLDYDEAFEAPETLFQIPETYRRAAPPPLGG